MLEVLPIQTKLEQEAICARCGVEFKPDCMAYHALVDGNLTAVCQFTMDAEGGHIHNLAMVHDVEFTDRDRIESLFVMGRATLNFIDLCGFKWAFFDGECTDDALLRRIGFTPDENGRYCVDLDGFFTPPCNHHPQ